MHSALDHPEVPEFFVRFIIFHEMLHAELKVQDKRGRRCIHSREFRRREHAHPDFERAKKWEREFFRRRL